MQSVSNRNWWMLIFVLTIGSTGCTPEAHRRIRFPNFSNPGPAASQRAAAIYNDPYPLNDIGPEVVGGRPLGFTQPLVEVDRARLAPLQPVVIQQAPMPGTAVVAPPVVSSPIAIAPPQPAATLAPATAASPITGPPIVTSPTPGAASVALPAPPVYPAMPAPLTTPAYPASTGSRPMQPRASY
jgi:hypothetical protein